MKKRISLFVLGIVGAIGGVFGATRSLGTIETAQVAGERARATELKGRELGLNCITNSKDCADLIARAERNPQLKAAMLKAKAANVGILPESFWLNGFRVGEGYVTIRANASDQRIIAFLTK